MSKTHTLHEEIAFEFEHSRFTADRLPEKNSGGYDLRLVTAVLKYRYNSNS